MILHAWAIVAWGLLLLVTAAPAQFAMAGTADKGAAVKEVPEKEAFDGEWRTSIGTVKLKQTGSAIVGTYGNAAFQQEKRDEGYAKYQEIVDKYYAASSYRNVKRWLAERK